MNDDKCERDQREHDRKMTAILDGLLARLDDDNSLAVHLLWAALVTAVLLLLAVNSVRAAPAPLPRRPAVTASPAPPPGVYSLDWGEIHYLAVVYSCGRWEVSRGDERWSGRWSVEGGRFHVAESMSGPPSYRWSLPWPGMQGRTCGGETRMRREGGR